MFHFPNKLEYDFLEYLKKPKANISFFELMKLHQIKENFTKTLRGEDSNGTKNNHARKKKGTKNAIPYNNDTPSKSQVATNASLIGQRSRSTTSPFLITFEIFNRNVLNCMVDLGSLSNVMPLKACENINVKLEASNIQIFKLDITRFKLIGELNNVLIIMSTNPKIHQTIDIIVVDIPNNYGMLLSRD
jgi:hypothetical protein